MLLTPVESRLFKIAHIKFISTLHVPRIEFNCYAMRISVDFHGDDNNFDDCNIVANPLEYNNLAHMVMFNCHRTRFQK